MATPAERKALLFLAAVALLGGAVRLWRSSGVARSDMAMSAAGAQGPGDGREWRGGRQRAAPRRSSRPPGPRRRTRSRSPAADRDSVPIIDLDRASTADVEALAVLPRGVARLIVEDRNRYGPFGSLDELRRVSTLTARDIRKLAPYVTFSLLPRPENAVIDPRPRSGRRGELPAAAAARRWRTRGAERDSSRRPSRRPARISKRSPAPFQQ